MAVGDEDVARGRRHDNIGRLIEEIRSRPGNTGLPERQQHLTLRVELEDLMPLAVLPARVGHPEVAVPIDGGAVRKDEHPLTPRLEQPPAGVVLQNRRFFAAGAGVRKAPVHDVDRPVGGRLNRRHRSPLHA